jgi:hypothetical protein
VKAGKCAVNDVLRTPLGCAWAERTGNSIRQLVAAGATVLIAAANEANPFVPDTFEAIALGPNAHQNRCLTQHGINLPYVPEARVVSAADPATGNWNPEV